MSTERILKIEFVDGQTEEFRVWDHIELDLRNNIIRHKDPTGNSSKYFKKDAIFKSITLTAYDKESARLDRDNK